MPEGAINLAFLDCETTSLNPETGAIWQLYAEKCWWNGKKLIVGDKLEVLAKPEDDEMLLADKESLRISRYWEVLEDREKEFVPGWDWETVDAVHRLLDSCTIVGAVPSFDTQRVERLYARYGLEQNWHHRLVCVENLAAAKLGQAPPWSPTDLTDRLGVTREDKHKHDARYDVQWAKRMFEAVYR